MPSIPRRALLEGGSTFHVTWQCHNQDWILEEDWAKAVYYNLLLKYKDRYKVSIYSYCLMDNHVHLSGTMKELTLFSDFFRVVNSIFARYYNKEMYRKGQVVMDRFRSPCIQTDRDLLKVMLYIDLNPKRALKVSHPRENEFSSFRYYAYGDDDPLITPAPSYLDLAVTPKRRQAVYQALVRDILQSDWKEKKHYSNTCFIGNPRWVLWKTRQLKEIRASQIAEWRKRYETRFS